jgi:hypothetical protein
MTVKIIPYLNTDKCWLKLTPVKYAPHIYSNDIIKILKEEEHERPTHRKTCTKSGKLFG